MSRRDVAKLLSIVSDGHRLSGYTQFAEKTPQTIEKIRDLMHASVKGDKRELDAVFGGECVRIGKVLHRVGVLDDKLSEM